MEINTKVINVVAYEATIRMGIRGRDETVIYDFRD